ncbi:hypothetical protein A8B79_05725 [Balneola sp. EhC07]|uniref:hypothetical protein n=1 Tax=Balneola sp. EhC07 TaxID=1849360 RepID=UPI0007F54E83|nr:hypothetical protein [Balneola sp. EhC07]OAN61917.1 hypothetical protein A8B79_05725 [Balneola sp. EhC07]
MTKAKKHGLFFTISLLVTLLINLSAIVLGFAIISLEEFVSSIFETPFSYWFYFPVAFFLYLNIYLVFAILNWKQWSVRAFFLSNFILFAFVISIEKIMILSFLPIFTIVLIASALFFEKEKGIWFKKSH